MTAQAVQPSNLHCYHASQDGGRTFIFLGAFFSYEAAADAFRKEYPYIGSFHIGQQGKETRLTDLVDEDSFRWMVLERVNEIHGEGGIYVVDEFLARRTHSPSVLDLFKKWLVETDQKVGGTGLGAVINLREFKK